MDRPRGLPDLQPERLIVTAYKKIPGSGKRLYGPLAVSICKLWMGPDHLLSVDQYGFFFTFHEKYRRFYYGDIQAVSLRETDTARKMTVLWSVLLVLVLGFSALVNSTLGWTGESLFVTSLLAVPSAFFLLLNFWKGPSCQVKIHTAVQSETLPSINRLKRARHFFVLLQPRIEAAQGALAGTELSALSSPAPAAASAGSSSSPLSHPPFLPDHLARPRSTYFMALSIGLVLHAAATGLLFFQPSLLLGAASALLGVGVSIFWTVAMVQASKYRVTRALRKFGWTIFGYISVLYMISIVYYSILGVSNPALSYDAMEWLRLMGERPVSQSVFLKFYDSFIVLGSGSLGIVGLILQRPRKTPASAA